MHTKCSRLISAISILFLAWSFTFCCSNQREDLTEIGELPNDTTVMLDIAMDSVRHGHFPDKNMLFYRKELGDTILVLKDSITTKFLKNPKIKLLSQEELCALAKAQFCDSFDMTTHYIQIRFFHNDQSGHTGLGLLNIGLLPNFDCNDKPMRIPEGGYYQGKDPCRYFENAVLYFDVYKQGEKIVLKSMGIQWD